VPEPPLAGTKKRLERITYAMRRASSIAARANAARLLAAYFLSNTFLVFGLTQCVREQAVQVTSS
jgi:hypothetical protein